MNNFVTLDVGTFVKLEEELSLFERNYNGFYYWQSIRFIVCSYSLQGNYARQLFAPKNQKTFMHYFTTLFQMIIPVVIEAFRRVPKAELIFLRDVLLSDQKFFDSWDVPENIKLANYKLFYTERNGNDEHFLEWPKLKTAITHKIRNLLHLNKKDQQEKNFLIDLEKRLIREFGQAMSAEEMESAILYCSNYDENYCKAFKKLFAKIECRAIAFEGYYLNSLLSAIRVAQEMGITTIEFQHGTIINHQEYWFEDRRGLHNYTPDYLLTFGEAHNSWIKLVEGHKAIAIGYPFQEKMVKAVEDIETNDKEIVIYPQSDSIFEETLNQFTNEITKLGYIVYVKIHPLEMNDVSSFYPLLSRNKNLQVITSQKEGVYYWLKKAKHHIMATTTVGLEAMIFDHSNVCIALNTHHDTAQCLLDWGTARGFSTAEELKELILNPIDLTTESAKKARERLWRSNASNNMKNIFREFKAHDWKL